MKKLFSYTMIALLATIAVSIAAPSKDEMMAKEKAAWQAFKDKDADGFKKVVDGDMIGVYADGISDMAKEMADMQKWDMKSFKISDYKAISDEPGCRGHELHRHDRGHLRWQGRLRHLQRRVGLENGERQMARHLSHQREGGESRRANLASAAAARSRKRAARPPDRRFKARCPSRR